MFVFASNKDDGIIILPPKLQLIRTSIRSLLWPWRCCVYSGSSSSHGGLSLIAHLVRHTSLHRVPALLHLLVRLDHTAARAAAGDKTVGAPASLNSMLGSDLSTLKAFETVLHNKSVQVLLGESHEEEVTNIHPQPPQKFKPHQAHPHMPHPLGEGFEGFSRSS